MRSSWQNFSPFCRSSLHTVGCLFYCVEPFLFFLLLPVLLLSCPRRLCRTQWCKAFVLGLLFLFSWCFIFRVHIEVTGPFWVHPCVWCKVREGSPGRWWMGVQFPAVSSPVEWSWCFVEDRLTLYARVCFWALSYLGLHVCFYAIPTWIWLL